METTNYIGFGIAIAAIVTWVLTAVNWVWVKPKKLEKCLRKQGFNGNSYRFLFGDIKENSIMLRDAMSKPINLSDDVVPRVLPFLHQSLKTYGEKSFMWMGQTPRVHVMNPELMKDVLSRNNNFQKPISNPLVKLLGTGLASHEGEQWAKHRRIINPAFHIQKLKNMLPAFHLSCSQMTREWELILEKGSCELDVWPYLQNMTRDVISRTAFGSSYEEGTRIFDLLKEQASLTIQLLQSIYIPGWRYIPTKINRRMKKIDKEIQVSLKCIINKREKAIKEGEGAHDDLLGVLLESNYKEINENGNDKKVGMSIKEVIDECKLFYFAGQETTSVLLLWTMVLLSKHQNWQSLAREEVLQVFGKEKPNFDGLNQLKIVAMILYEVLRLYPPVPVLTRAVYTNTNLGKFSLPAGIQLSLPLILVQCDHEHWGEDAKEFKPDRFSEGVSKATKSPLAFIPFGWGPRTCIGQNFAMTEAKMAVAIILQRFSFEISPSYTHAPVSLITLQPQHGAHLIMHKL